MTIMAVLPSAEFMVEQPIVSQSHMRGDVKKVEEQGGEPTTQIAWEDLKTGVSDRKTAIGGTNELL